MKLLRLATYYFDPPFSDWREWRVGLSDVVVETMGAWEIEGKLRLLVVAQTDLPTRLSLTNRNLIIIPDDVRKRAEAAIEATANMLAITQRCKRSIASPSPTVALLIEDAEDQAWLASTSGIEFAPRMSQGFRFRLDPTDQVLMQSLSDRWDGVALLAEALAHDHATGRFHEFMRLFERAFALGPSKLVEPLAAFLAGTNLGYTAGEVQRWTIDLRHPATHADRRPDFVLEADVQPVIPRMEQAAYDILFNKATWRSPTVDRRATWSPPAGTRSDDHLDLFIVRGSEVALEARFFDEFGSYPLDLSAGLTVLPNGWWADLVGREAARRDDPSEPSSRPEAGLEEKGEAMNEPIVLPRPEQERMPS